MNGRNKEEDADFHNWIEYDCDAVDGGNFGLLGCIATVIVIIIYALIKSYL